MDLYTEVNDCRVCKNNNLDVVIDLGNQALSGIFPKKNDQAVPVGPLTLVKCSNCGLVQLAHNYNLSQLYGDNYGYRSGLNASMTAHLNSKVASILQKVELKPRDVILDIGSNDSTLLRAYPRGEYTLIGMDPSGNKFKKFYPSYVNLVPDFFSSVSFSKHFPNKKVKVITSIAMFYDLEHPLEFVNDVVSLLESDGIWVFEQSYLPFMLEANSFDTICHEHLEYYALNQIKYMLDNAGLKIIDLQFNDINGGSFSIMAAHKGSDYVEVLDVINDCLNREKELGLNSTSTYIKFQDNINNQKSKLLDLLRKLKSENKKVIGYGASTKGNVLIQYYDLGTELIPYIAEVNVDKFGVFTPGSNIPIISEKEAIEMNPDYFLVFPWHFREFIIKKEQEFLKKGGRLIFPLPNVQIEEYK